MQIAVHCDYPDGHGKAYRQLLRPLCGIYDPISTHSGGIQTFPKDKIQENRTVSFDWFPRDQRNRCASCELLYFQLRSEGW